MRHFPLTFIVSCVGLLLLVTRVRSKNRVAISDRMTNDANLSILRAIKISGHAPTQGYLLNLLYEHAGWNVGPRVMVDLGSMAAQGPGHNESDVNVWIDVFSKQHGYIFALDILPGLTQHIESVLKILTTGLNISYDVHLGALTQKNGDSINFTSMSIDFEKQCRCYLWGRQLKRHIKVDVEHAWVKNNKCKWDALEGRGHINHLCRVNRQIHGLSPSTLPFTYFDYRNVELPTITLDTLYRSEIKRHIDFLKVDIDQRWETWIDGGRELVASHRFSIASVEYDIRHFSNASEMFSSIEKYNEFLNTRDYRMLLKVPYVRSRKFVHNDNLRFKKTGFVPITSRYSGVFKGKWGHWTTGCNHI